MVVVRNSCRWVAVATLVLVPTMSGCAAGRGAQTSQAYQATEAVSATHEAIDIRNMFVLGPAPGQAITAGAGAAVYLSLINNANAPERLVAVGAPGLASSGRLPSGGVQLPPRQLVSPGQNGTPITLEGLATPLRGGEWRKVTLQFQQAGAVTVNVPVVPRQGTYTTYAPAPVPTMPGPASGTPAPGESGAPSPGAGHQKATPSPKPGGQQTPGPAEPGGHAEPGSSAEPGGTEHSP